MDNFGIRILEGYGATECAPVLAVNTPMAYRAGSVGTILPGIDCRLQPLPGVAEGGVLHVHGPNLMKGYYLYDNPGVIQPPVSDLGPGWYGTGDVVQIDSDGFLFIRGRVKRFAKIAGEMISLEVLEKIAQQASSSGQHAATTQADPKRGESLILYTTDPALERDALLNAARSLGVPELAVARRIVHLKDLPLLGTGKTDYVSLKAMAESLN
jgi:acyl-[acyl-carrier-protein]-phospholipid O-acyltransferase/long-chain-fatty-acid--[acyl-carrier-protein] ligase